MKLVVDTNVIFSALMSGGKTREIILRENIDFYVPEYFFTEVMNNSEIIKKKTDLSGKDLSSLFNLLLEEIEIIPKAEFDRKLSEANSIIEEKDPDDAPFLALALKLNADIWSDDKDFQEQEKVKVWTTGDLVNHLQL